MSGTLPTELMQLTSLSTLLLNDQANQGFVGNLLDFAFSPHLLVLNLANNSLSGTIPTNLLASVPTILSKLQLVDLTNNLFEGSVPVEICERSPYMRLQLADNMIDQLDPELCVQTEFMLQDVELFGCDAILCPPDTYNAYGRQVRAEEPCMACETGTQAEFFGSTLCRASSTSPPSGLTNEVTIGGLPAAPADKYDSERDVSTFAYRMFLRGGNP